MKHSYITVTDQFCGAGGSSLGAVASGAEVKLAMNHWKLAIETHNTNFPNTAHDCTDISAADPRRYPSTDILITSPECTNHSLAKGKRRQYYTEDLFGNILLDPEEERSRATMWDVPRFAEYHSYNLIVVENVVDAARWRLWDSWLHAMHALGYEHEIVYFNSMFAWPTPQSRDRLYTIFWRRGNQRPNLDIRPMAPCLRCGIVEAVQSWKKAKHWGRYKQQYLYRCPICKSEVTPFYYAAFNAIDWSIPAQRIGDRKKPLKPKTMERVRYGWETYGQKVMIVTGRYTSGVECRVKDASQEPLPTQPGDSSHAVVAPYLVETGYSDAQDNRARDCFGPSMTQTTRQTLGVVGFLSKQYGGDANPKSMGLGLDDPTGTITTWDHHALLAGPSFVVELHNTSKAHGVQDPLLCVTANGNHHALVTEDSFLTYYYKSQQASRMDAPIGTVTTVDRVGLVGEVKAPSIEDLTFRMLQPHEIGKAMAFPGNYVVLGNNREKVRQYGNAVTPPVMRMILERCIQTLR